jgi:hypothetical protein
MTLKEGKALENAQEKLRLETENENLGVEAGFVGTAIETVQNMKTTPEHDGYDKAVAVEHLQKILGRIQDEMQANRLEIAEL